MSDPQQHEHPAIPNFADVASEGTELALQHEHEAVDRVEHEAAALAAAHGDPAPDPGAETADEHAEPAVDPTLDTSAIIASLSAD